MAPRQRRKELDLGSLGVLRGMRGGEGNPIMYPTTKAHIYIYTCYIYILIRLFDKLFDKDVEGEKKQE